MAKKSNNHIDCNINNLRNNPSETYIENGISKDDITNRIRKEANSKNKKINEWGKYERREFNRNLWGDAKNA